MYLLYVDSSGAPELNGDRRLYATIGVCIQEGAWFGLERRVRGLKNKYSISGEDFELHAKDFSTHMPEQKRVDGFDELDRASRRQAVLAARHEQLGRMTGDKAKNQRKKFLQTDPFVHLSAAERHGLMSDTLDLVGSHDGIRLFGEVADKAHLFGATGAQDSVQHSFTQIVSRFNSFLRRTGEYGRPDKGILVMDNEPAHARKFAELLAKFRNFGHPFGVVDHVIETPFFVDSRDAAGIQLADICAYAARRYIENGAISGSTDELNFVRIFHKFDREGPQLHGIRHYCKRNSCRCIVCKTRNHYAEAPPSGTVSGAATGASDHGPAS